MRVSDLEPFVPPPPAPKPTCISCLVWAPECLVPAEALGEGGAPVPMCWMCAHAVTEHGASLADALERSAACKCGRSEIFPASVLATRMQGAQTSGLEIKAGAAAFVAVPVRSRASVRQAQNRRAASMTAQARRARLEAEVNTARKAGT